MDRNELVDLIESMQNATNAVTDLEHNLAMGGSADATDKKLVKEVRKFVAKWREIAFYETERLQGKAK